MDASDNGPDLNKEKGGWWHFLRYFRFNFINNYLHYHAFYSRDDFPEAHSDVDVKKEREIKISATTTPHSNFLENNIFGGGEKSFEGDRKLSEKESLEAEAIAALPRITSKTTIIHSSDESPQDTFERLIRGIKDGSMDRSEIIDQLFNVLVGGQFDMETRYIIEDSSNIERMLTLLTHSDDTIQAEVWSVFLAVTRKSKRNLEACSRVGLISRILDMLPTAQNVLSDLLVQLLGVLTTYSITVKETKQFLRSLQAVNDTWLQPRNSLKLLQVMKQMPKTDEANVFFSFPGKAQSLKNRKEKYSQNALRAVSITDQLDRCSIGVSPDGEADTAFCGQMGAVYLFADSMSLEQAHSLFCLGPAYQSYFVHDSGSNLPEGYKKHLFDGRLHNALVMAYCPKNCHGQLCLNAPSKISSGYFVQVPHAVMKEGVEVITTHSLHNSLQSVGGIQILLPLFSQLDLPHEDGSTMDMDSSSKHVTMRVAEQVIDMAKFLLRFEVGGHLIKQLFEHIMFNPQLWINSAPEVQVHLYNYLATEFLGNNQFHKIIRQVATFGEMCHALKFYYWVTLPCAPSVEDRPASFPNEDVVAIRGSIMVFMNRLILLNGSPGSNPAIQDTIREQEIHQLINFVATVHEDDNLYDILALLNRLLGFYPHIMIPIFDKDKAIGVVFKLLSSPNQLIRIPALKMFGYYLQRSTLKRKTESVAARHLFTLITERLLLHAEFLTLPTYNVLFEILTEQMTPDYTYAQRQAANPEWRSVSFENPTMLKVIANLITQSEDTEELILVKKAFMLDIINMCRDSKENRRTILQMSVWQDWLISLSYVFPQSDAEVEISELVYEMFSILLHHAIRYEYGGWRVWVDTLAIAHSKVSWERFRQHQYKDAMSSCIPSVSVKSENSEDHSEEKKYRCSRSPNGSDEMPTPIYRTPDFCWSSVHLRLLGDLLTSIENIVEEWKANESPSVSDQCNASENQVFVGNTVHVISQLADSLIMACGGLLPLLASATSPNSELEIVDACQQELPIECAASLLSRFVQLADVFVFASGVSFAELEQEKNMPSGGVLRQSLRLVATSSVRHILTARVARPDGYGQVFDLHSNPKSEAIYKFVKGALEAQGKEGIIDMNHLLQDIDLQRIKGIVYRDMVFIMIIYEQEENRQAQFLALAVIYLLSVLMVSRYRDILEPPACPSPFFNSTTNGDDCRPSENINPSEAVENKPSSPKSENGENTFSEETLGEGISAIRVAHGSIRKDGKDYKTEELSKISGTSSNTSAVEQGERREYLTNKLQTALETTAPLLREIMGDFRSFLQKTLLGTHGQEIMNDNKGRLMAHATRDHVLRVSNEADFILNRLRAEDVGKHAHFESEATEYLDSRKEEEARCAQAIRNGRRRDSRIAAKLLGNMMTILRNPSGAWSASSDSPQLFWRMDVWEDDSRRRKRFVPNVFGSQHEDASQALEIREGNDCSEEERLRKIANRLYDSALFRVVDSLPN
uniref:DUF4704 domain-containing protein n=1 Tax=Heterorhabditis bacteriophora TaxID=37862 RepID=A0A1I7XJX4_HETBA